MDIWSEPLRGGIPPKGFHHLPGIDRARAYLYGLVENMSVHHLVGAKVTQVGPGSAVAAMPASPWLAHANGYLELSLLTQSALEMAAITVADPGRIAIPRSHSYAQVRLISSRSVSFVARAEVVRTTERVAFCRATAEDNDGRLIAHGTGTVELAETADSPPPPRLEAVAPPRYATPDPYERPLPIELTRSFVGVTDDPIEWIRKMTRGEAPHGPIGTLLGFRHVSIEDGMSEVELRPSPWLRAIDERVFSSFLGELALAACGAATSTRLDKEIFGILSFDMQYLQPVEADGQSLLCRARADRHGGYVSATGEILRDEQLVARCTMLAIVLQAADRRRIRRSERKLASVVFTDIVASTKATEHFGDSRWAQTLEEHYVLARNPLTEFGGREIKTTGDGVLAIFDSPTDAIRYATTVRDSVRRLGIDIRAGIHVGEFELMDGDISGMTVNIASRVMDAAGAGEVLVSSTVRDLVAGSGFTLSDRGARPMKGVGEDVRLFALVG